MNKPKMIIFDYGHTLLCEPGFDFLRGEQSLFEYEDETMENPWRGQSKGAVPTCDHLHIHDWLDLIKVLEGTR